MVLGHTNFVYNICQLELDSN